MLQEAFAGLDLNKTQRGDAHGSQGRIASAGGNALPQLTTAKRYLEIKTCTAKNLLADGFLGFAHPADAQDGQHFGHSHARDVIWHDILSNSDSKAVRVNYNLVDGGFGGQAGHAGGLLGGILGLAGTMAVMSGGNATASSSDNNKPKQVKNAANYVVQIIAKVKVGEHSLDASSNLESIDSAAGGGNPIFSASIWPSMDPSIHEFIRGRDAGELRFQEFRERFGAHLVTSADMGGLFVITIRCGARLCGQAS